MKAPTPSLKRAASQNEMVAIPLWWRQDDDQSGRGDPGKRNGQRGFEAFLSSPEPPII